VQHAGGAAGGMAWQISLAASQDAVCFNKRGTITHVHDAEGNIYQALQFKKWGYNVRKSEEMTGAFAPV